MRNKINFTEMLLVICVAYTIISLVDAVLSVAHGNYNLSAFNSFNQILFSSIAVSILYTHNCFERLSPLLMVILQYVIAMGLVFLIIYLQGKFNELHPDAYRDIFVTFTIPYIIGASIYYVSVFREANKQNEILQEIKREKLR